MAMFGFPHWQLKSTSTESGVVAPDERLPFAQTAIMGVQHAVAMFGATVLMPILMGLDPNLSIFVCRSSKSHHRRLPRRLILMTNVSLPDAYQAYQKIAIY